MPPLKTFMFKNTKNTNIVVVIHAYKLTDACETLIDTVLEPNNYTII